MVAAYISILYLGVAVFSLPALAAPPKKPAAAVKRPASVDMSPAYNAYLGRLRGKVLQNWDFPAGKNHVVLQVTVNADGSSGEISLKSTPGNQAAEQAANAAFAQAQPLEPLPANSCPSAKITLTFDSTLDPHGDSSSNLSGRLDPIQPPKLQPAAPQATPAQGAGEAASPGADGNAAQ